MGDSGRILIADDETSSQSTANLLRGKRYHCDCAYDAAAAAQMLRDNQYDLLIADVKIVTNLELDVIRDKPDIGEGTPPVLVTASPARRVAEKSIQLPLETCLLKPPDPEKLCRHVHMVIQRVRLYRTSTTIRQHARLWSQALRNMHELLKDESPQALPPPLEALVQVTSQNIVDTLHDLRYLRQNLAVGNLDQQPPYIFNCTPLSSVEQSLAETIRLLEKTRSAFESANLGQICSELEQLFNNKT